MSRLISQEQKDKFLYAFVELMKEAPEELQKSWNGEIIWQMNEPHTENEVQFKLKDKLQDDFNKLLIKLSNEAF
jgi:hypothetical protein